MGADAALNENRRDSGVDERQQSSTGGWGQNPLLMGAKLTVTSAQSRIEVCAAATYDA